MAEACLDFWRLAPRAGVTPSLPPISFLHKEGKGGMCMEITLSINDICQIALVVLTAIAVFQGKKK